jgi:predicted nucleic acid-binding protein
MAYKIFFDINVVLDYTLQRNNFEDMKMIIESMEQGYQRGFITSATIHTLSYFLTKEYGQQKVKAILLDLLSFITVIDAPQDIINNALHANFNDIEDALQVYTALHYKMNFFLTSDKRLLKESSEVLPIMTAKDFVKAFSS